MSSVEDTKPSPVEGFRVFVGNLAYKVNNEALKEFFAQAGNVIDAVAVRRYGRSLGYGFVVFDTEEAQEAAVNLKDAELEGRKINVEKAVPVSERPPRPEGAAGSGGEGGNLRGRGRGGRRGRGALRRREPPTGEPSSTVIFVGNLPFNAVDDDLRNIFEGFQVRDAHVVRRFDGASRGFAFVTVESEEEQKKALEALSEVYCDDRRLIVRPALSRDEHKSEVHHDIVIKSENKEAA